MLIKVLFTSQVSSVLCSEAKEMCHLHFSLWAYFNCLSEYEAAFVTCLDVRKAESVFCPVEDVSATFIYTELNTSPANQLSGSKIMSFYVSYKSSSLDTVLNQFNPLSILETFPSKIQLDAFLPDP